MLFFVMHGIVNVPIPSGRDRIYHPVSPVHLFFLIHLLSTHQTDIFFRATHISE